MSGRLTRFGLFWTVAYVVGVLGLLVAGIMSAHAQERVDTTACNAKPEITRYFGPHTAVVYQLPAEASGNIVGLFMHLLGPVPPMTPGAGLPVQVYEGFDITDGFTTLFLYDAKGCFVNYLDGFALDDIDGLHEALDIPPPPYGDHYHQVPNMQGSLPGFEVGGTKA